ncbi:T9SS sorting signal type C domain-containing protein [Gaetbulibacter sp. PBL-D1]|uniref:T9SS sorting signal type C domain-containing protein n=1 Tax=Gaetbulibacter sp. PBL-D1 TaxID=3422594 RepID=UPI003D2EEDCD
MIRKLLCFTICFLLFVINGFSQSDDCGNNTSAQITVNTTCNTLNWNNTSNTDNSWNYNGASCGENPRDDAWGWFDAISTSTTIIYNPIQNGNVILTLFEGACNINMTPVACANDNGNLNANNEETITYNTIIGQRYRIRIQRAGGDGSINGTICVYDSSPVSNDNCTGAITLTPDTSCIPTSGSTIGATQSLTGCTGYADDDVWYSFLAVETAHTISVNAGSIYDLVLEVFSGSCSSLTSIECEDLNYPFFGDPDNETINLTGLTIGNEYFIRVYSYEHDSNFNDRGTFDICITTPVDPCSTINTIASCGNTVNATIAPGNGTYNTGDCGWSTPGTELIYEFTPTIDGDYYIDQDNSFTYIDYMYKTGTCDDNNWTCIDAITGNIDSSSFTLTANTTYYIMLDPETTSGGNVTFSIVCPCDPGPITSNNLPGCPSITAGGLSLNGVDPPARSCTDSGCITLEASYLDLGETTDYTVEHIGYNPPYQFNNLANPVSVNIDDVWSPVINLPFNFCFYGNNYNQCVVGSNGVLSFDTSSSDGDFCEWQFNDNLPSTNLFLNTIFGTYQDIDPSEGGEVGWELVNLPTGCRALVAAWHDVPMYQNAFDGDGSKLYTGMIVLYENTNVIDIYIEEKVIDDIDWWITGDVWNEGNAIVGIQNSNGTQAVIPPCRNGLDQNWSTTTEAWRFIPSGNSLTSITWYEGSGTTGPVAGTGNTICVDPAITTTYTAEVTYNLCNGTIRETDETVVTINDVKIWDGSEATNDWMEPLNWSDDTIPTSADCVVIPITGNDPVLYTNDDGDGLNLTVHDGATLTVQSDASVTIVDFVDIQGAGTIQINSSGSLIQVNDVPTVPNTGNITMNRDANIRGTDYVYWSSPVNNFNVNNVSPGTSTNYIYEWITTIPNGFTPPPVIPICFGNWSNSAGSLMQNGKGYIVRGPDAFTNTPATFTATFNGVANNGIITKTINSGTNTSTNGNFTYNPYGNDLLTVTPFDDNWNLLGNPYPSALDAQAFLTHPNNTIIEGAVHIWTHGSILGTYTDSFYEDYVLNYNISDYVTYNFSGTNTYQDESFSGQIASGQGFFVLALNDSETGSVTFNNSMRQLSASYDNSQFYRTPSSDNVNHNSQSSLEKHRIWLNLVSPSQLSSSILVGYIEGATNQKDRLYDAYNKEFNALNLYSKIDDKGMIIQGRALPFDQNDQVHLGTVLTEPGIHTIAISNVDGLFTNEDQNIYLEDTYTNTIHDLKISPYIFSLSQPTTFDDRFILRYTNETLDIDKDDIRGQLSISAPNGDYIKVKSETNTIDSVIIYDLLGRKLFEQKNINQLEFIIRDSNLSDATYIVKVTLTESKKQKIQRIILKQ